MNHLRPGSDRVLDDTDLAIIEHLQRDGRAPYADIAGFLGLDEHDVSSRAEALVADGTIDIVAVSDPFQVGYARQAVLGIEVDGDSQAVGHAVARLEEVIYLQRTEGALQLLAEVVGESDARLLEIVTLVRRIPGVVRIHPFLCVEVVKETYAYGRE